MGATPGYQWRPGVVYGQRYAVGRSDTLAGITAITDVAGFEGDHGIVRQILVTAVQRVPAGEVDLWRWPE